LQPHTHFWALSHPSFWRLPLADELEIPAKHQGINLVAR
jgi:hypothetical protein